MLGQKRLAAGVAHPLPSDMKQILLKDESVREVWEDLTPLARNEWICWTISVKKAETRAKHLSRFRTDLLAGKRRPCCWIGCQHRTANSR